MKKSSQKTKGLPSNRKTYRQRGMSLVEVMTGSVVLLVVLISAFAVILQGIRTADEARRLTTASSLLQTMIENMRMMPYSNLCTQYLGTSAPIKGTTVTHLFSANEIKAEGFSDVDSNAYKLEASFNVKEANGGSTKGQVYADIKVEWKTMTGRPISRTYFTIFSEGGVSDSVNRGW